jgi:hypothetical protein
LVSIITSNDTPIDLDDDELDTNDKDDTILMVILMSLFSRPNDYFGLEVIEMMLQLKTTILLLYHKNIISKDEFLVTNHEKFHDALCMIQNEKLYKLLYVYWDRQETKSNFIIDKKFIDNLCTE